jgi:hypothetical protein
MKYAAITLNALATLVLIWALTGLFTMTGSRMPHNRWSVPEVKLLADNDIEGQNQTLKALDVLSKVSTIETRKEKTYSASLQALIALPVSTALDPSNQPLPQRRINILMKDDTGYAAMIDGVLVRSGQLLEAQGRVLSVSEGQVVVSEKRGKQTLTLPVDSLRVGALRKGTWSNTETGDVRPMFAPQDKAE